jgi:polysaccharide pyruvyl transferase WcaK-like protein
MKIAYYVDSSSAVNWGGQATSAGIRHLVEQTYPDAEFVPVRFRPLPFRNATYLRRGHDRLALLLRLLDWYGIDRDLYRRFDVVCFNGEGAIHDRSGHVFRLLGSLYAFKRQGVRVYSVNQTVDVRPDGLPAKLIREVYPLLDRVAVREPRSLALMHALGLDAELVGDAAYALPRMAPEERATRFARHAIAQPFIAVTASSSLRRDSASVAKVDRLLQALAGLEVDMVFLANTKTDLYIARQLQARHRLKIVDYETADYLDAIAIISMAALVVGGRQHPNIFAAKYGVPFIGLDGNTHKMRGVAELLNYPLPVFQWDFDAAALRAAAQRALAGDYDAAAIRVPVLERIDLGPAG